MPVAPVSGNRTSVSSPYAPPPDLEPIRSGAVLLRRGASCESVRQLQELLSARGYPLTADGAFGPKTEAAVREFQRAAGLKVDGIVGRATLAALEAQQGTGPTNPFPDVVEPMQPEPGAQAEVVQGIPERPAGAMSGSQFIEQTKGMTRAQREQAILAELRKGNVPDFVRTFKEVRVSMVGPDGKTHEGIVRVLPDNLAIGSNEDFVRIPMNPLTAQRIADQYGCLLPTRKVVDAVYAQAEVKLRPSPMTPGPQMMSNDYYLRHQRTIESQRAGKPLGALTAGHKKDVIISNALVARPDRVCIYGWHQPNGKAIQPLSTVHENTYADYSHGVRLVSETMIVDGVERPVAEILRDPILCKLVSDEGPIRDPRIPS